MANNGKIAIRGGNGNIHSIQSLINSVNGTSGQILAVGGGGGGAGAIGNVNWTNNIFAELNEMPQELVRKYEIYESKEDLLVLSCAWYRLREQRKKDHGMAISISKLLDRNLFNSIIEADRELATQIRDYYSKKIMVLKLKNERMSSYRDDLNEFIHSDGKKFVEKMFGLVYRLPQFYFYDTQLDSIFSGRNRKTEKVIPNIRTRKLTHVGTTFVDRRALKRNEYWFTDDDDTLTCVYLAHNNPLNNVWEKLIQHPIDLKGQFYNKSRDDTGFYVLEKFDLVI